MIAVALSPKARALIQADRNARRPTSADRDRVAAALRTRLGSGVLPVETGTPQRFASSGLQRRSATALGVCVVGSVLFLARRPAPAVEHAAPMTPLEASRAPATTAAHGAPVAANEPLGAPPEPTAPLVQAPKSRVAAAPAQDVLAQEVSLLSSATRQLAAGQLAGALLALDEHQRRFPRGTLSDERNAAKARTLCMLHRFRDAQAPLASLPATSPLAQRAKLDCDSISSRASARGGSRSTD